MDLIRLLRSLEEFLYELVGWVVFYPRTFWQILVRPGAIARYTHEELGKPLESRFQSTISPVLMLILTVAIGHGLELALRVALPPTASPVGRILFGSEEGIMLTRSAIACLYALGAALGTLRRQRVKVTRETLREPFSLHAFLACPFVLVLAAGNLLAMAADERWKSCGYALQGLAVAWYLWARTTAFRALNPVSRLRAFGLVLASFAMTTVFVLVVGALLVV